MIPRLPEWNKEERGERWALKRGGGGGSDSTVTSYATVPPSATETKDRHLHPEIAGSTGGFIGLISGLAIFLVVALVAGLFVWNRWFRKRIGPKAKPRHVLPSVTVTGPHDPFTNEAFEPSLAQEAFGESHRGYVRGRGGDEDWEEPVFGKTGKDKGKGKATVEQSVEFDADDYSLRSFSPLPRAAQGYGYTAYSDMPSPSPLPSPGLEKLSHRENPFLGREERGEGGKDSVDTRGER